MATQREELDLLRKRKRLAELESKQVQVASPDPGQLAQEIFGFNPVKLAKKAF